MLIDLNLRVRTDHLLFPHIFTLNLSTPLLGISIVASPPHEVKKETSVAEGSGKAKDAPAAVVDKKHEGEASTSNTTTSTSNEGSTSKPKKRRSILGRMIQQFKQ